MAIADLTVTVRVTKRPVWKRVLRVPATFRRHYRTLRRSNGRVVSLYATWVLAGLVLRFK